MQREKYANYFESSVEFSIVGNTREINEIHVLWILFPSVACSEGFVNYEIKF